MQGKRQVSQTSDSTEEETQLNSVLSYFQQRTHQVKSVSPKTGALRRPMIRLCQALMLILAASVCSGQIVTNSIRINLTIDGYVAGPFTEITGVDPQLNQTSST